MTNTKRALSMAFRAGRKTLAVLLILCRMAVADLSSQNPGEAGFPYIRNFSPKEYGADVQNWDIVQDDRGVMYFGNNLGLLEYDGANWRLIQLPNKSVVRSLTKDATGRIYLGGVGDLGYLESDSNGKVAFFSLLPFLPEDKRNFADVWEAWASPKGIFFHTDNVLMLWLPEEQKFKTWEARTSFHVSSLAGNELYIRQWDIGLMKVVDDSLKMVPGGEQFANERVYTTLAFPDEPGKFLIGTRTQGLFIFDGQTFTPFPTEVDDFLRDNLIYKPGLFLSDGRILIQTLTGGALIIDRAGRLLQKIDQAAGLQNSSVLYAYEDRAGALWLGLDIGVARIETGSTFSFFDSRNNLTSTPSKIIRYQGRLYIATTVGVFYLDQATRTFRLIPETANQSSGFIVAAGQLLAANADGIFQITGTRASPVVISVNKDFEAWEFSRSKLDTNRIFVGLYDGLASLYLQDGKWTKEGRIPEVDSEVRRIVEQEDGGLWLGTTDGTVKVSFPKDEKGRPDLQHPEIAHFGEANGLGAGSIGVFQIKGETYFVTGTKGVFSFREEDQFFIPEPAFNVVSSLGSPDAYTFQTDHQGRVWICFGKEIAMGTEQPDGSYLWEKAPFLRFSDDLTQAVYVEEDGVVWFGGPIGLTRYDPRQKEGYKVDFQALIRRVTTGNGADTLFGGWGDPAASAPRLAYGQNSLRFEFSAPSFEDPSRNRYQTWLEGFEKNWSAWTTDHIKEYTNLPPGTYHFHIKAKNAFEHESSESVYSFTVRTPWFQSWWALLLYTLSIAGLIYAIVRWRTRQLKARSLQLETAVQERTGELHQRLDELATVNQVSSALVSQLNVEDLLKLVGEELRKLFQANIVYIAIHDKESDMIHFPYEYGDHNPSRKFGQGLTEKIIASRQPLLINQDVRDRHDKLQTQQIGIASKSYLGVPIPIADEIIGVLSVQSTHQENRFGEDDMRLLHTLAANIGSAIRNARLYEEAQIAKAAAEEANEAKSSFLSTVSHELRTPLTSVLGFAKIVKKRLEDRILPAISSDDPKVQKAVEQVVKNLDVITSEGERLTQLINDVLDLAKIEAGKIEWHMEPVAVEEIVDRAIQSTRPLFLQKHLALEYEIEENLPLLTGDRNKLIQVLINLLSNASKFTKEGRVVCKAYRNDDVLTVSVSDTGIGIAPADQPKVFEKFKQVGDTLTDKPQGTGLGLPICKEIIEHHGGRLWLESTLGKGSTFYFSLPLTTGAETGLQRIHLESLVKQLHEQLRHSAIQPHNNGQTILVVDDDLPIRSLLRQELTEAGYLVHEASNGREAVESVRQNRPDLIILDVMMPEMNGFDVAAVLKNDPQTMEIPIIILSIIQDKERGMRIGVDRYLTKPIDTGKLFSEVGRLLEQGQSRRKVMVVDENVSTIRTLTDVLQAKGYQVVEANGEELMEKALSTLPDVIILNAKLSGQHEAVKALRFEKGLENVLFLVYE